MRLLWSWETWVVLGLSLLLTGIAWWLLDRQDERLADARFRARARDLSSDISARLESYEQMLRGGVALMDAAGGRANRATWRAYVAGLHVEDRYPGIQGIGFAKRVDASDLEAHEAAVRSEGFHGYRVTPGEGRPEYFPIIYLEPFASRNLRAFGYDMHSDPVRRAAMERARDSGVAAATGKVRLVQETEQDVQSGFLIYLPVYDQRQPLTRPADRHAALLGFVYAPFRMRDLMGTILDEGAFDDLELQVFDGQVIGEMDLSPASLMFERISDHEPQFQDVRTVHVFGRPWIVRIASSPALEAATGSATPTAVLVAGLIITLLLVAVLDSVLTERGRMAELRRSYDALAKARAEAEEANAAKSRFLAAASHDLRQPLQTLGIYLHLLAEHPSAAPMRKLVDAARDGFEATQRLLNSLMDIASLETGVLRPQIQEIDLPAFLARIGDDIRVEAAAKGLDLRIVSCEGRVATDPAMLERIVRNLLHNALKYTRTGTVRLACGCRNGEAVIKVQDTGPGIPRDRLHLIFEDFYQIGNPERDRSKGLGLGLATVARLVRLLGYRIRVLSRPGRGAVFIVEIPGGAAAKGVEAVAGTAPPP